MMQRYGRYKDIKCLFSGVYFLVLLFNACSGDDVEITPDRKPEQVTLKFYAKVPATASNSLKTYALDVVDERHLETVDILVFTKDIDNETKFNYRVQGRIIEHEDDSPEIMAKLWKTEADSRVVILANVQRQLSAYHFSDEETLAQMQSKLQFELEGVWPARLDEDGDEFVPLPMWAELDLSKPINEDMDLTDNEVFLLRSVARVDVQITGDAVGSFNLQSVHVFNNNQNGLIIPDPAKATMPSLPIPLVTNKDLGFPLEYETDGANSIREIYLFEAGIALDTDEATALVIGGTFNSTIDPDEEMYFYRIDFRDEAGDLMPLLRNHKYVVNITKVDFNGSALKDKVDAFNIGPSLIPQIGYFGSHEIKPTQSKPSSSTRRTNTSVKSSAGLQYTITTVNEQD